MKTLVRSIEVLLFVITTVFFTYGLASISIVIADDFLGYDYERYHLIPKLLSLIPLPLCAYFFPYKKYDIKLQITGFHKTALKFTAFMILGILGELFRSLLEEAPGLASLLATICALSSYFLMKKWVSGAKHKSSSSPLKEEAPLEPSTS